MVWILKKRKKTYR